MSKNGIRINGKPATAADVVAIGRALDADEAGDYPPLRVKGKSFDEKNAAPTMKLRAKSGYASDVKSPAISASQWGAIQAIWAEETIDIGRQMIALFQDHLPLTERN